MQKPDIKLPYLQWIQTKGRWYPYYRRGKVPRQRIEGDPGSIQFIENYHRIHVSFEAVPRVTGAAPGSYEELARLYLQGAEYRQLSPKTKEEYRSRIERGRHLFDGIPVAAVSKKYVKMVRDDMQDTPAAANSMVKVQKTLWYYAMEMELVDKNPWARVKAFKGGAWEAWPAPALERAHTTLTGPSLTAFLLALYTGQRKGDVLKMRWHDIDYVENFIRVVQQKTDKPLQIPIHPTLAEHLNSLQRNGVTVVGRRDGRQYTISGFNRIWRRQQAKHGFTGLKFHGLRRNAVNALLEAGCEVPEVSAVTGQSFEMVQHYAAGVNQGLLAQSAMNKLATKSGKPLLKVANRGGANDG